jgi:ribosomal protein S25
VNKKAQLEKEKADKKAQQEKEKAEKKAQQEKEKKEKAEQAKIAKNTQQEKVENEAVPPEDDIVVKKFTFEGRVYLRSADDVLYDIKTQEPVGMWNEEENCIDEIEVDEE